MTLKIKRNKKSAALPVRATQGSAGLDLCACIDSPVEILAGAAVVIPTGISVAVPENFVGLLLSRSGHGINRGVVLSNSVGVIDSDYRGEVMVGLRNLSGQSCSIQPNERIAQLLIIPAALPVLQEVQELDRTERGAGGFGSTGRT